MLSFVCLPHLLVVGKVLEYRADSCIITFYIWFCREWTNKDNNEWTIDKISFFKENVKTNMYHTNYCLNLAMGMNYVHLWVLTVVQIFFWAIRTCNFWAEEARDKGVKTEAISGEFIWNRIYFRQHRCHHKSIPAASLAPFSEIFQQTRISSDTWLKQGFA